MTTVDASRQRRLAERYLITGETPARLGTTIAMAARTLGFPLGQINIVDDSMQYTVAHYGLPDITVMPRSESLCQFAIADDDVLAVEDLLADPRFAEVPSVQGGLVRSYLGIPLHSREFTVVGTLCVVDCVARGIDSEDIARLRQLAEIAEDQLDLLRRARDQKASRDSVSELVRAIKLGEIVPWYQPVVNLEFGRVIGYEALARWQHRTGEIEDPSRFVGMAEDSDVVMDLDLAVMRRALRDVKRWRERRPDLAMGVNLSTRHLETADGVEAITAATRAAGIEPDGVVLELTETRALRDGTRARSAVAELRELGYRVLLDDFGSGWSSFDWVLRLDVDGLKIDRAMTMALGSPIGDAIVRALGAMTQELKLDTVVEGITTSARAEMVRAFGFENGQGFYWSPPVPAARIDAELFNGSSAA